MNKTEAIKVLSEINDGCKSLPFFVRIARPSAHITETAGGYQITLKSDITLHSRKCIKQILEKYKLGVREEKGFVIFYTLDSNAQEQIAMKPNKIY